MTLSYHRMLVVAACCGALAACADPFPSADSHAALAQMETSAEGDATPADTAASPLPAVTSVERQGPFAVTTDQRGGAQSWVFRPTDLGRGGVKHPVFIFGNGATASPSYYATQMRLIASHGIIVVNPITAQVEAKDLKAALDWILGENERSGSVYYQKLSGKAAMGGHSKGSLATFDAEATETRLTTTIHVAGGSFDGLGSSKVKTPTAYICGAPGANGNVLSLTSDIAQPNCDVDFQRATQPTYYTSMRGTSHLAAVGNAAPAMVAWLRWHLAGEVDRKAMFTGPSGQFFQGIFSSAKTKNW